MATYNVDLQDDQGNSYRTMANPDSKAEFTEATSRENINSGETHRTIFGKLRKFLSDLGAAAYIAIANNCTTTAAGFALDARQGKVLMDKSNQISLDLGGKLNQVISSITISALDFNTFLKALIADGAIAAKIYPGGGLSFQYGVYAGSSSAWYTGEIKSDGVTFWGTIQYGGMLDVYSFVISRGADAVLKKLGSDPQVVTKSATYPMATPNSEQTVNFSVTFDAIPGYKLAYAGIQQLNTYISNGTIRYVEFTNQRISGNTVTWSVHTQRGTGGGNNTCVVQGVFIPD